MSPWALAAGAAVTVLWFFGAKGSRKIERGGAYFVVFKMPPAALALPFEQLKTRLPEILPPGSDITTGNTGLVSARFIAPTTGEVSDVPTPLGTFQVVSVTRLG